MAGLIRTLFKSKKAKKEEESEEDTVFQPCKSSQQLKRQPTTRFADDGMLSATAAYHTTSAPRLRKGPQSCPGDIKEESIDEVPMRKRHRRQNLNLDHYHSHVDLRDDRYRRYGDEEDVDDDEDEEDRLAMFERKSQYYMQRWEDSERQRHKDRRRQEQLERERNSIQSAMSNMAFCMASVQQLEQLKKERDQYKKEMSRYKNKCEKLETKLENATMSPSYGAFQHYQSPYQTPQFPPAPLSFNYQSNFLSSANRGAASFSLSHTPTTIGSDGAGESLVNPSDVTFLRNQFLPPLGSVGTTGSARFYDDEDGDEVKDYRKEGELFPMASSPFSELTQNTDDI